MRLTHIFFLRDFIFKKTLFEKLNINIKNSHNRVPVEPFFSGEFDVFDDTEDAFR